MAQHSEKIVDTVIASERKIVANQRRYSIVEIHYAGISFLPGQVMMIRTMDKEVAWPYAYLIQKRTRTGFVVVAPEHSDLYQQAAGAPVVVWGPRGRSPLEGDTETFLIVTEAAAYPACLPFALDRACQCKAVIFVDEMDGQPLLEESVHFHRADSPVAAAAVAEQCRTAHVLVALNPQKLLSFTQALRPERADKFFAYMPTIMVCGVGGCTSCAIHDPAALSDPTTPTGILMCCKGPYQPLDRVDIAADIHSFETFL